MQTRFTNPKQTKQPRKQRQRHTKTAKPPTITQLTATLINKKKQTTYKHQIKQNKRMYRPQQHY